ncbi:hypothetical protein [Petropleomorpha daqingensis]|uniref:Uncharacterized protein n=1 Tax=Petropleomorpha daqingensis TaxID=2026353 RepID=A0A853CMC3_9ACTN|nr:hypothetical protein [Petropleomorpha daqingensis]NYJ08331.1 hypothetical protein [Petropleomorpha daqingensis]
MSSRLSRALLVAGVAGGLVAVPAVAAWADPPGIDPPSCAHTLARVHQWPGTIATSHGTVTLVSDAYDSYLARQPECAPGM